MVVEVVPYLLLMVSKGKGQRQHDKVKMITPLMAKIRHQNSTQSYLTHSQELLTTQDRSRHSRKFNQL